MATLAIAGVEGQITGYGSTPEITKWNLNIELEALDATSTLSGGWKEHIVGLVDVKGSMDSDTVLPPTATAGVHFIMPDTTDITCDIQVTNVKPNVPVKGVVTWTVDFVGNISAVA